MRMLILLFALLFALGINTVYADKTDNTISEAVLDWYRGY